MAWIRLAILMVFILAVAGCGGDSSPLRSEMAARQAQVTDEADVDAERSTLSTVVQDDTVIEEDALAEERRQLEEAIMKAETEAGRRLADAEIASQEAGLKATADFAPYYVSSGEHAEFDGHDVRVHLPIYSGGYPVVLNSRWMKWMGWSSHRALRDILSAPGRLSATDRSPPSPCAGTTATTVTTWRGVGGFATRLAGMTSKRGRSSTGLNCEGLSQTA